MISNCALIPRRQALSRYLVIILGTAITAAVAALASVIPVTAAAASAPASGGSWSWPRELSAPRYFGGFESFSALSCASRWDCTAVGTSSGPDFAITERRGAWGKALGLTAPIASKKVHFGGTPVLSCASAGNCAAGDSYYTRSQSGAFVVSQTNGTWGKPRKVRTLPTAISCPAPGDCTAALARGYLLNEKRDTWRKAFPVPGLAALLHGQSVDFPFVISCPSPGNCAAGGASFVVTERHGIWSNAQPVRIRSRAGLLITAVSCPSAGNCVAGGYTYPPAGGNGAFAVTETHGTWGTAESLPGTSKLGSGIDQLDCPAVGACSALGTFVVHREAQPFVSTEKNGTWHDPQTITGAGPGSTEFDTLTCPAVGSCVFAGAIVVRGEAQAAFAAQLNGRWGPARILRGIRALDHGEASSIEAVSCPARSRCTAVGSFGILVAGHLFATAQR
jgi:hypothetical protein